MAASPAPLPTAQEDSRVGIVDIGSNSVRLVVYAAAARAPAILFNEKVMAGLGKVEADGRLSPAAVARAMTALRRFRLLLNLMGVRQVHAVATAAARDAADGAAFVDGVRALGLPLRVISGGDEARFAGEGVLAAVPDAAGTAGDLGGGSLELVTLGGGRVGEGISLPLGVLRLAAGRAAGDGPADALRRALAGRPLPPGSAANRPFYLVGGSWRALALLDMRLTGYPLPVVHGYAMPPGRAAELAVFVSGKSVAELRALGVAKGRAPMLRDAAELLAALAERLAPSRFVASAQGLREGLLHDLLSPHERDQDPLLAAARDMGQEGGRFGAVGDRLCAWLQPLFAHDPPKMCRLREAACLLSDVAWRANPDYRAEWAVELALHGHWVAIDGPGRALLAQTLHAAFGGGPEPAVPAVGALLNGAELARARAWGLAMRLGQRLAGGVADALAGASLRAADGALELALPEESAALYGEAVERRHRQLANELGLAPILAAG